MGPHDEDEADELLDDDELLELTDEPEPDWRDALPGAGA